MARNASYREELYEFMDILTFWDQKSPRNSISFPNPATRCNLPTIPGILSRSNVMEASRRPASSINFPPFYGSICGPGIQDGNQYVCSPPGVVLGFFGIWFLSLVVLSAMRATKCCAREERMHLVRLQRNMVGYGVCLLVSTASLIMILGWGRPLLLHAEGVDVNRQAELVMWIGGFLFTWILHMWELIYRVEISKSLMVHHLATLLLCTLGVITLYDIEEVLRENGLLPSCVCFHELCM